MPATRGLQGAALLALQASPVDARRRRSLGLEPNGVCTAMVKLSKFDADDLAVMRQPRLPGTSSLLVPHVQVVLQQVPPCNDVFIKYSLSRMSSFSN